MTQAMSLNRCVLQLTRRSERVETMKLVDTFVDSGPLFTLLSSHDHQVMFGRRGTGKTHALKYLLDTKRSEGDIVCYVDLSNVGSSGGIYGDPNRSIPERATRLLVDTLQSIHEGLLHEIVGRSEELDLSQTGPILDSLADETTNVAVVGSIETMESESSEDESGGSVGIQSEFNVSGTASVSGGVSSTSRTNRSSAQSRTRKGEERCSVNFGGLARVFTRMLQAIEPVRIWLLFDEWSSVPTDLQPYLADLLRRSVFPITGITAKIAAIEHRSQFAISDIGASYVGLEIGADAAADINLDDFMVFDNDAKRARDFYRALFFRHVSTTPGFDELQTQPPSEHALIQQMFTQVNTFDELVRASEGVPRDAINILMQAAQYADQDPINMPQVRRAAQAWYHRDKETALRANPRALRLLHWTVEQVIGERRARAFLIRSDARDDLIDSLFDARILHLLKKSISTHDEPGIRYHVYKLDYGCYVDLMNTAKAPQGLLPADDAKGVSSYVEVPPDDYRAIRRAILRLPDFYREVAHERSGGSRN